MKRNKESKLSWRKRLSIAGLVLFTLYLCFGIWAVPAILISQIESKGSEALGRDLSIERATFNPFSLEAKLYGVKIGPKAGESEDLLSIGKLSVNPQLSSVFGTITLKSVEVSEGDVWVEKTSNGEFSFQDILDGQAAAPADEESGTGELPAVIVNELLLADLEFHYKDSSLATSYEETARIDIFQGRDIGTVEKSGIGDADTGEVPYHWDFDGKLSTASGAVLNVDGGATSIAPWRFRVNTELVGFPLASAQPYIDESLVAAVEGTFGFALSERIDVSDAGLAIVVGGSLGLDGFSVSDSEQVFARLPSLKVNGLSFDASAMSLFVDEIALESPEFEGILLEDGSPRLPAMKESEASPGATEAGDALEFAAKIESVVVSGGRVAIEDRSIPAPFKTDLDGIELKLAKLSARQNEQGYDSSGSLDLALKLLGGNLKLKAGIESLKGLATAELSLNGVELKELQPYVAEHANAELEAGSVDLDVNASLQGFDSPTLAGSFQLNNLKVKQTGSEKEIVTLSQLNVSGIDFGDDVLRIGNVSVIEPIVAAWQDEAGINWSRIEKLEADVEQKTEDIGESTGISFFIDRFELKSAGVGFVDTTLLSNSNSRLSDFDFTMEGLSTNVDDTSTFEFAGVVDGSARIAGNGSLAIADPGKHLDLDMSFRGYDLTATSPYWATYLGRKLSKGQFEIISHYEVRDNQLNGTNDFKIDQLTLGEKVQSDRAINLPLGFAIKLMQDPSGMIAYEGLPVAGDLSDPQVKPWGLVGRAVRNLLLNAVASPFKFLAKMAGGRDDLDSISFAVAEVDLSKDAHEKTDAIRKVMVSRPGLNLEVSYLPDPKERQYLEDQYAMLRMANPDFQVVSGLDLLRPVDPVALESAVRKKYAEISLNAPIGSESSAGTEEAIRPAVDTSAKTDEERKGIVQRFARFLRLGKKSGKAVSENAVTVADDRRTTEGTRSAQDAQDDGPSFEEMLKATLRSQTLPPLKEDWINDLSEERIRNFKTALLEGQEIEGSRVFSTEVDEATADAKLGSIVIRLAE